MPLTATAEPGVVDAFGVHFDMEERGRKVRCHVFRSTLDFIEDTAAKSGDDLLARFKRSRGVFERTASALFDAGHRTPWIDPASLVR